MDYFDGFCENIQSDEFVLEEEVFYFDWLDFF